MEIKTPFVLPHREKRAREVLDSILDGSSPSKLARELSAHDVFEAIFVARIFPLDVARLVVLLYVQIGVLKSQRRILRGIAASVGLRDITEWMSQRLLRGADPTRCGPLGATGSGVVHVVLPEGLRVEEPCVEECYVPLFDPEDARVARVEYHHYIMNSLKRTAAELLVRIPREEGEEGKEGHLKDFLASRGYMMAALRRRPELKNGDLAAIERQVAAMRKIELPCSIPVWIIRHWFGGNWKTFRAWAIRLLPHDRQRSVEGPLDRWLKGSPAPARGVGSVDGSRKEKRPEEGLPEEEGPERKIARREGSDVKGTRKRDAESGESRSEAPAETKRSPAWQNWGGEQYVRVDRLVRTLMRPPPIHGGFAKPIYLPSPECDEVLDNPERDLSEDDRRPFDGRTCTLSLQEDVLGRVANDRYCVLDWLHQERPPPFFGSVWESRCKHETDDDQVCDTCEVVDGCRMRASRVCEEIYSFPLGRHLLVGYCLWVLGNCSDTCRYSRA
jgi:hypothetical protein